jgi:acetolactate synthase-1/2/3 large subunit
VPTAADLIARRLYEAGCRHAFGIPGGEVLTMMHALQDAGIAFALARHENAAGFMAEGTYQATGAPGILLATIGPGVANAVNVVANALQDRVPLIVLTGCIDEAQAFGYTHQVLDHRDLLRPVTKASFKAVDGAVDVMTAKALAIALGDQPGPVHIDIPISLAKQEQTPRSAARRSQPSAMAPAPGADLEAARNLLAGAERPLMVAGLEVLTQDTSEAVADFCRDLAVPLITTYKAKGVLPEDEPLAIGGAGLSPAADKILMPLVEHADLIIAAGYDPIEMRSSWCNPWDPGKVIEFTAVANTHHVHQARYSFVGHPGKGLEALRDGINVRPAWPGGEAAAARAALKAFFASGGEWGPAQVVEVTRRTLPRNAVATADTGAHRILLSQLWECFEPRGLLQSSGLCTMGCALPLAMGYKLARPERPVIAFTGDAGLEMVLGELATLRDLALPIIVVVFVDASLALIEMKQRRVGLPNLGVDFGVTDFAGVASALGGHGEVVRDAASLERALGTALEQDRFTLLACSIVPKSYDGRI